MKQAFVFLVGLTIFILTVGAFEGCGFGSRGDEIVITNEQLEAIIGYYPDKDKTDSTFNMIVYFGLQPDANRDSLTHIWNYAAKDAF